MNSRQRRKSEAERHNAELADRKIMKAERVKRQSEPRKQHRGSKMAIITALSAMALVSESPK